LPKISKRFQFQQQAWLVLRNSIIFIRHHFPVKTWCCSLLLY
jgi:hypothetical protein